jgi:hypothetical protein
MATADGFTDTPCEAVTFRVAAPVSPDEVAVTVTVAGLAGAVNSPAAEILPPPATLQVIVPLGWLAAKAVN